MGGYSMGYTNTELFQMPYSDVLRLFETGKINRVSFESFKSYCKRLEKATISKKMREDGVENLYAPLEFGVKSLVNTLENGGSHKEALMKAVISMGFDEEWLTSVKDKPYGVVKETLAAVKDHPEKKVMMKNGTWNQTGFKRSPTVNSLVIGVSKAKRLSDTLEELKEDNKVLKSVQKRQGTDIENLKVDVESIKSTMNVDDRMKVYKLHKEGHSATKIIELTMLSKSKVYRFLKELKN